MSTEPPENQSVKSVAWPDMIRFVRQLSHDLRNDLNAAELQAAYIGELTGENAELKGEVKRLREMILKLAVTLQGLSGALGQVKPTMMSYRVSEFDEDLRQKISKDFPDESAAVKWEINVGEETFEIDPQLLQQALLELFRNAFQHGRGEGPIFAVGKIDNETFTLMLREPKTGFALSTENWGQEPLANVCQGHYGLGLNRARAILEAHGGKLRAQYDPTASELVTTVALPISGKEK
jgi:K+-sensing histidine kinase KdpD